MAKFDPVEFFKEMQGVLKQFREELRKEVDEKIEKLKEERTPPLSTRPIGLLKKEIFLVDWQAKMTRIISDQETKDFSQELFNLMQKYGFDALTAKRKKEGSNPPAIFSGNDSR